MADPVTMAVVGGMAGAAMSPKDPLKGALLGAVGGYGGGAMLGAAGVGGTTAATTAANTVGATGGGFAGGGFGSVGLAGQTASAPSGFLANTMAGIGQDVSAVKQFAEQNPFLAKQAGGMATDLLSPQQPQMPQSPGLVRGQQIAQEQPQYNPFAAPNISLI